MQYVETANNIINLFEFAHPVNYQFIYRVALPVLRLSWIPHARAFLVQKLLAQKKPECVLVTRSPDA